MKDSTHYQVVIYGIVLYDTNDKLIAYAMANLSKSENHYNVEVRKTNKKACPF